MFIHITITQKNVKVFPVHSHDTWEYICYEEGEGVLKTEEGNIPFKPGTVICVPPNCKHGSKSENHFKNICIHTNIAITDNQRVHLPLASKEVRRLFNVIGNLYREKDKYMSVIEMLLPALKDLILKETELSVESGSISFVHNEITKNFMDTEFDLKKLVKQSGYVDDVLRVKFKGVYGVTPKEYLDNLRLGLASFSNLLFIIKKRRYISSLKFYLFLALIECIIWEIIRPFILMIFNPFNKNPKFLWGDMIAYAIGTLIIYLIFSISFSRVNNELKRTK